jgi:plasmid stabilization system protein ParE
MAEKIVQAANVLIAHPFFGRAGRVSGTRERVIPGTPFIIIYRAGRRLIAIERVIHGSQNWPPA